MTAALRALLCALTLLTGLTGCDRNQSGNLRSATVGDLGAAPAPRARMDLERAAQCGRGESTARGAAAFARTPYLQRVDAGGASVLFTIKEDDDGGGQALSLVVSTPDGETVLATPSAPDPSARPQGAVQMRARAEGLSANTLYCYQLVRGEVPLMARAGFRTAPAPGDRTPFAFVAFGDSGGGTSDQRILRRHLWEVPFDFFLLTGDVAYERGTRGQFEANHFGVYGPLLRLVPHYPSLGNHEYKTADAAPYLEVFELPENGHEERYYTFDWGPVHFIALDTHRFDDAQERWLVAALEATEQPFVVVYGHHPPFSSGKHGDNGRIRRQVTPHLAAHRVQLMLAGHDHHYERHRPVDGVTYVVTGAGGRGTRSASGSSRTAFVSEVIHFTHLAFDGESLVLRAIDATGQLFDSAVFSPR